MSAEEYDRMVEQSNRQQAENAKLKEQVAQARYTNAVVYGTSHPEMYKTELDYAKETIAQQHHALKHAEQMQAMDQETIAQQAEAIRVKDEALKQVVAESEYSIKSYGYDKRHMMNISTSKAALAIHPNPDILRERDARLVRRIAEIEHVFITPIVLLKIADKIEKGEWK